MCVRLTALHPQKLEIKPVTPYYLSLLKASSLLLKIQSSAASSSILFWTQSAQQLLLISFSFQTFLSLSTLSPPLCLSLASSSTSRIGLETVFHSLFAHSSRQRYVNSLPSSCFPFLFYVFLIRAHLFDQTADM